MACKVISHFRTLDLPSKSAGSSGSLLRACINSARSGCSSSTARRFNRSASCSVMKHFLEGKALALLHSDCHCFTTSYGNNICNQFGRFAYVLLAATANGMLVSSRYTNLESVDGSGTGKLHGSVSSWIIQVNRYISGERELLLCNHS